ncbi:MAG: InlB B-repeat-containing protein [Candidatus Fibromonas sp.]|jgi:uncharacterized protein (TIGR02145 family)/uncharacterized repeat protein (TIGR02543 family)|nr:InlB B-repeat-containing protein [Candidatus Fibromonas sp.]
MKTLALITTALTFVVLGCSNPYERDNPTDPIHVYTITFNAPDATGGTPPVAISGSYGDVVTLPNESNLWRSGYAFNGWADTSTSYRASSSYTIKGNAAMNANWLPAYTVTYDGNGATSGSGPSGITAASGSSIQLSTLVLFGKTGYVFDDWTTNSSGTGTKYKPGSSFTVTGNVTFYANWFPASTITFDGNGASGAAPAAITVANGSSITLGNSSNLEKTGHLFTGWNTNSSGTGTTYRASSSYTVAEDITLYAIWADCSTYLCDTRDEQAYRITTIGTQTWMAENLNYWITSSGAGHSPNDKYGHLYDWTKALNLYFTCENRFCSSSINSPHRGICPEGWHIPSGAEWGVLTNYVESNNDCISQYSCNVNTFLKATSGWNNDAGNGTDDYGFSALPGGYSGKNIGSCASWWIAGENSSNSLYAPYINIGCGGSSKGEYRSVRCLKDGSLSTLSSSSSVPSSSSLTQSPSSSSSGISSSSSTLSSSSSVPSSSSLAQSSSSSIVSQSSVVYGTPVTYGGQTYKTVVIGTQTWFAENLNYNATGSVCNGNSDPNCNIYGRLYDWSTAMGLVSSCNSSTCSNQIQSPHQGICPEGWHIVVVTQSY